MYRKTLGLASLVSRGCHLFRKNLSKPMLAYSNYTTDIGERVKVSVDEKTGVAVMQMSRKPVNSLNLDMLRDLDLALEKLENDKSCRGLILTSSVPGMFSAGLDILEMYNGEVDRMRAFWSALQDFWIRLYGTRLTSIAAISGHSPAGGCLLSMSCDLRIMAEGPFTIGLNETLLGLVAPFWFCDVMKLTVGHRETEKALQLGSLYSSEDALRVGLIDQIVPQDQLIAVAQKEMARWLKIPDAARHLTKLSLRQPLLDKLQSQKERDIDFFINFVTKDFVQKVMGMYLESLKKKSK